MRSKLSATSWKGNCSRFLSPLILGCFAVVFGLICVSSSARKSPTVDEPLHLLGGYSYLKWNDFRVNPVTPPFSKIWAALPLLALDIKDPRPGRPQWDMIPESQEDEPSLDVARDMFFVDNDGAVFFLYAKLQMIALGIFLGASVYLCSKRFFGLEAAISALFIFALDPNILAHSQIIHGDIPSALFSFLSVYFFWCFFDRASWSNLLLTSLFFGMAAVTKYTYATILMVCAVLGVTRFFFSKPQLFMFTAPRVVSTKSGMAALLGLVLTFAGATAYLLIWACYGFRFDAIPGETLPLPMNVVMLAKDSLLRQIVEFITEQRLFPEAWIYGQLYVLKYLRRTAFLLGEVGDGFWSYFPVAFGVKTPLPTLVLLAAGLFLLVRGRMDRKIGFFLLVPPLIFFASAVLSRMNIGLRHILPIYPFLFVFAGAAAAELWKSGSRIKNGALPLLAVWYVSSCIWIYPDYLSYFNEIIGGPKNGHRVLLDSNLDWGQDLKELKRWMDANGVKSIQLLYFGTVEPEYYGIDASYLPGSWVDYDPPATQTSEPPQYVAMSAHLLYTSFIQDSLLKPFRQKKPLANIGRSIFIFKADEGQNP